jgi:hypothetical protein
MVAICLIVPLHPTRKFCAAVYLYIRHGPGFYVASTLLLILFVLLSSSIGEIYTSQKFHGTATESDNQYVIPHLLFPAALFSVGFYCVVPCTEHHKSRLQRRLCSALNQHSAFGSNRMTMRGTKMTWSALETDQKRLLLACMVLGSGVQSSWPDAALSGLCQLALTW